MCIGIDNLYQLEKGRQRQRNFPPHLDTPSNTFCFFYVKCSYSDMLITAKTRTSACFSIDRPLRTLPVACNKCLIYWKELAYMLLWLAISRIALDSIRPGNPWTIFAVLFIRKLISLLPVRSSQLKISFLFCWPCLARLKIHLSFTDSARSAGQTEYWPRARH